MTWAKIDDKFWSDPKVVACSDSALGLWVRALSYCAEKQTDGVISLAAVRLLNGRPRDRVRLVSVGLWDKDGPDFIIRNYLKYNPSKAETASKREAKRIAGAIGAASRWHSRGNTPVPVPVPVDPDDDTRTRARARPKLPAPAGAWWEYVTDKPLEGQSAAMRQVLLDVDAAHPASCVDWAFTESIGKADPWRYAKRVLDSCTLEGHGPRKATGNGNRSRRANGTNPGERDPRANAGDAQQPKRWRGARR